MRPGLADHRLVDDEGDEQHAAAKQQRHHRARFQPVQAIALVEAGIDHRDRGAEQQHAAPVGVPNQFAIDRLTRRAEIDHQPHQRRDHDALPIQPLPSPMLDIEADQRARRVERKADADRIDRDRRQPPADRQVSEHDHQRRRHEGPEQHAMHDGEHDQRREIVHERDHQRDHGVDQAGNAEHAAHAERGRKPRHRRRDEDLRADAGGREPGALVEPERERAAQDPPGRPSSAGCRNWRGTSRAARPRPQTAVLARYRRARRARGRCRHLLPFVPASSVWMLVTTDIPGNNRCSSG